MKDRKDLMWFEFPLFILCMLAVPATIANILYFFWNVGKLFVMNGFLINN